MVYPRINQRKSNEMITYSDGGRSREPRMDRSFQGLVTFMLQPEEPGEGVVLLRAQLLKEAAGEAGRKGRGGGEGAVDRGMSHCQKKKKPTGDWA